MRISVENGKIFVGYEPLPKGLVKIIQCLLEYPEITAFEVFCKIGDAHEQYTRSKIRTLKDRYGLLIRPKYARYDIVPEIKEELKKAVESLQSTIQ